ncbi:hypothetical protein KY366_08000, partial [Candidatus Woesearchaeota archaeon]|nr:hypothetical protein [Candidatus Woesearchaeota archaeon]
NKLIDRIIDNIEKSLKIEYWIDELRLNTEKGEDNGKHVFLYESKAVVLCPARGIIYKELEPVCEDIEYNLVGADLQLGDTALDDAENTEVHNQSNQRCYDKMLELAEKAITKAEERKGKLPGVAIINYMNAWRFSQKAIEFAESSEDICKLNFRCLDRVDTGKEKLGCGLQMD